VHTLAQVAFQWDPKKAKSNSKKHGLSFADAVSVFEDAEALTIDDPHPAEQRFVTLGLDSLGRVLVVCWTQRGDDIRIYSARRATAGERRTYERGD
jgi:uncharacterized DUF497 family protein